jgi:two-component system chemotaxis response regulator CheB
MRGPSENGTRPAVDPLFRTAADAYGARVIGVVLSGNLDDGTAGLIAVQQRGGVAIVQDPEDALFPGMPSSAAEHVRRAQVLPLAEIPAAILAANAEEVPASPPPSPDALRAEVEVDEFKAHRDGSLKPLPTPPGEPSGFTCPHCRGALWEIGDDGGLVRYRCRVGHAFSPETLVALDSDAVEEALWVAYRALEESAALARRMEARAERNEHVYSADRFRQHADELESRAAVLRNVLVNAPTLTAAEPGSYIGPE